MLEYHAILKEPARELRKNMTDAERQLWTRLRKKQLLGFQFYRQKPIGGFIVDFYAPAAHLVIEVDGSQHFEEEHHLKDVLRDQYLAELGLVVMRFDNLQVLRDTEAVVNAIVNQIRKSPPPPLCQRGE